MLDIKKEPIFPYFHKKLKTFSLFRQWILHQKPQIVIDAISKYYQEINANIHRGVCTILSQLATDAYEISR
jgi:cysteine desulfurase/selenocysteine lyase